MKKHVRPYKLLPNCGACTVADMETYGIMEAIKMLQKKHPILPYTPTRGRLQESTFDAIKARRNWASCRTSHRTIPSLSGWAGAKILFLPALILMWRYPKSSEILTRQSFPLMNVVEPWQFQRQNDFKNGTMVFVSSRTRAGKKPRECGSVAQSTGRTAENPRCFRLIKNGKR